jgi:hypothetical protein
MRRFSPMIFASVSFAALLIAVGMQASAAEVTNLGLLHQQDKWRVGTVDDNSGKPYCAMVNKFSKGAVLALARNPDGYGSLAVDFEEKHFTQGMDYEVGLSTPKGGARTLQGNASTEQSMIIQIGQDEEFFQAVSKSGTLDVSMPVLKMSFSLAQFSTSYKDLADCAGALNGKAAVASADAKAMAESAKTGIDREVDALASGTKVAAASASSANALDAAEDQMEAEAKKEETKPVTKAAAEEKKPEEKKTEEKKTVSASAIVWEETPASDTKMAAVPVTPVQAVPERKLLATTNAGNGVPAVSTGIPAAGVTAQRLEQEQLAMMKAQQQREALASADAKKTETSMAEAPSGSKTATGSVQLMIKQQPVGTKMEEVAVGKPRAVIAEEKAAALEQDLKAKNDEIAALEAKAKKAEEDRAAEAQSAAAAQAEWDKAQLAMTEAQKKREAEETARLAAAQADTERARIAMVEAQQKRASAEAERLAAAKAEEEHNLAIRKGIAADVPPMPASVEPAPVPQAMSQVAAAPAAVPVPSLSSNRAAAFLDKIMTYHRPGGTPPSVKDLPLKAAEAKPSAPIVWQAPEKAVPIDAQMKREAELRQQEIAAEQARIETQKAEEAAKLAAAEKARAAEAARLAAAERAAAEAKKAEEARLAEEQRVAAAKAELERLRLEAEEVKKAEAARVAAAEADLQRIRREAEAVAAAKAQKAAETPALTSAELAVPPVPKTAPVISNPPEMTSSDRPVLADMPAATSLPPVQATEAKAPLSLLAEAPAVAPFTAAPVPAAAPVVVAETAPVPVPVRSKNLTLETLLDQSGLPGARFVSVDATPEEAVRQWVSGDINGMYEFAGAGSGNFDVRMERYLDRYRQDCPGHLDLKKGEVRNAMTGTYAAAVASCTLPSNQYSTSFVFVQGSESFGAIMHTGRPSAARQVMQVADRLTAALGAAQSFAPPLPVRQASVAPEMTSYAAPVTAAPVPAAVQKSDAVQLTPPPEKKKRLKFNIQEKHQNSMADEFATVVIE